MGKGSGKGGGGKSGGGGRTAGGAAHLPDEEVPFDFQPGEEPFFRDYHEDPVVDLGGKLTGPGQKVEDIDPKLTEAIHAYSGGYIPDGERFGGLNAEELNKYIYDRASFIRENGTDMVPVAKAYIKELRQNLDRVRNYQGEVYRVIGDSDGNIAAGFTKGGMVQIPTFISTSRSPDSSFPFVHKKRGTRFVIQSKRGKWIEKRSLFGRSEAEVLFKNESRFHVTDKKWNPGRHTWDIFLTEI